MQDGSHSHSISQSRDPRLKQASKIARASAAAASGQGRVSLCNERGGGESGERGAYSSAFTLLFRTCCICCGLYGVYCTRAVSRACCACCGDVIAHLHAAGAGLGWTRSRGDSDVKRGRGGGRGGGKGRKVNGLQQPAAR